MEATTNDDLVVLLRECLSEMGLIEAAFIEACYLAVPRSTLKKYAARVGLSPKKFTELRSKAMARLRVGLAEKNVHSMGDVL